MKIRKAPAVLLAALLLAASAACSSGGTGSSGAPQESSSPQQGNSVSQQGSGGTQQGNAEENAFAKAHDAFQTTLTRQDNDNDPIPDPPEGMFDLVYYPSKVGDLAAYVSSDPGDGEKHPMIIWVVGGWGNGIDDFPWTYPAWDDDQTGSAFWRSGVLTMYPSFRGGVGNPGYYEALFGEVDDIVSAYEYAASLPYVDPERIYLGGHSTGGTRALLASEYTDQFRAVFCFGAVDEVKYHNNSWFTFDTDNAEEFIMRSPLYWLDCVKSPTFLIEGSEGNAANLRNIEKTSNNENIHCYIIDGADHWGVLAPITPLLAQKILADTGAEPNITLTQEELEQAMAQEPVVPLPVMSQFALDELGLRFSYPYLWEISDDSADGEIALSIYSPYDDDNVWDMATMYVNIYSMDGDDYLSAMADYMESQGFEVQDATISGLPAFDSLGEWISDSGNTFNNRYLLVQNGDIYVEFDFYIHESYGSDADPMFQSIVDSIEFVL